MLPVKDNSDIDYAYMEERITELEEKRIVELEKEKEYELKNYLKVTELNNYDLSDKEQRILKEYECGKITYDEYELKRVFDIKTTKKKFNANSVKFGGLYPYVIRSSMNNGIRGYITEDEQYLNDGNTISFGQDTATMFYQAKPYFTGDKIKVFYLIDHELTEEIALYLIVVMRKAFSNFSWGGSSFNENVLKKVLIKLPINNEEIDFQFMSEFIKIQKKLSIKNVIDWKNKIINTTKKFVRGN
jgi:hypothetical protein